jgi:hypothetical protein
MVKMADKIFEDNELIVKRFPCDCKWQGHSLEIAVELADKGKRLEMCSLNLFMAGKSPLRYRFKQAWECLKGRDGQLCDFILRAEDIPEAISILRKALTTVTELTEQHSDGEH